MKKLFSFALAILPVTALFCQSTEVSIPGSRIETFTSSIINGQEYVLQIYLPAGYGKTERKYPVVYLLDAQWDFPLLTSLYGEQYFDGFIPELIIVGITWGGSHPNPDSLRARDFTPTKEIRLPQSGDADKFLSVIKQEVFPLIESRYRAKAMDRTLAGCSLGGLFTLYALFTHPELFSRYIAASPAFMWNNHVLSKYEGQYFADSSHPASKLFMCIGGVESTVAGFKDFASVLVSRHDKNLELESKILENTGHSGTKGEGYARGLQFVFKQAPVNLTASLLQQYEGDYKSKDGSTIEIKISGNKLIIYSNAAKITLTTASETDFYLTSSFLKIHFVKDEKGKVAGLDLARYGSTSFMEKVK